MFIQKNESSRIQIADKVQFGEKVVFGPNCKDVSIGFGTFIGRDIYIDCEYLSIGEYTTIHHGSIIHGKKCNIGHNCWFGHYTIIDSVGGWTRIGNNVGVGAHSQLWSHIKFGDTLAGCCWNSSGSLTLEDDVWLVGHCIIGSIYAEKKAMLMTGSVAVHDMKTNRIYAGSPAKDMSEKFGTQFIEIAYADKLVKFNEYKHEFFANGGSVEKFEVVDFFSKEKVKKGITQFNLNERTYMPTYKENEMRFIKSLLYEKAKFIPISV
ncbi:MAG: hypothetical protein HUN04_14310 [Desulfobacter sp.]|nr:MAG: hypothetical protein HUN04_14310 [Desulfobacter sp.]